jgi:hypothetical protein
MTTRQFHGRNHFIGFIGVHFDRTASRRGTLGKEIVYQFDDHATKTRPSLIFSLVGHECRFFRQEFDFATLATIPRLTPRGGALEGRRRLVCRSASAVVVRRRLLPKNFPKI